MRHRIKDYTISGQTITIPGLFDIEDIRLIVDETLGEVLLSSTDKGTVATLGGIVTNEIMNTTIITIPTTLATLASSHHITIEVDKGDDLDSIRGNNVSATNSAILSALNGIAASMYKGVPIVNQNGDVTIAPNVWNVWGEVTSLNVTKGTAISGIVNNYMVRFTAGEGCVVNFLDFTLQWYGGGVPEWVAGNTYEVSIVDDVALWAEFEPKQA